MTDGELLERITVDAKVMSGKPVIKGTRLIVEHVLSLLAHGATVAGIARVRSRESESKRNGPWLKKGRYSKP